MTLKEKFNEWREKILEAIDFRKDENVIEELSEKTEIHPHYLERFGYFPIENVEQLQGREYELDLLRKAYENWKISNNLLLVVGDPGTGVSSLINSSCNLYPHAKIIDESVEISNLSGLIHELRKALGIDDVCETLADVKSFINEEEVVVIENVERLFIRTIDGFHLLDDFLLFMHETKDKIYWICSINRYSHYYLNQVKSINSNFLSLISLRGLDNNLLREVINKRNEGYKVTILKPSNLKPSGQRKLKKASPEERESLVTNRYYRKLFEYSNGNISRAFIYWKQSIVHMNDKNVFLREPEISIKTTLSKEDLFVLEAILQHSYIKLSELKAVLRNSHKASLLIVEQLKEKELVSQRKLYGERVIYQINLKFLEEVKSLLRTHLNRNIK